MQPYGSLAFIASYILAVTFTLYINVSITNYFGILYNRRKECLLLVANLPKKIILCLLSQRCPPPNTLSFALIPRMSTAPTPHPSAHKLTQRLGHLYESLHEVHTISHTMNKRKFEFWGKKWAKVRTEDSGVARGGFQGFRNPPPPLYATAPAIVSRRMRFSC